MTPSLPSISMVVIVSPAVPHVRGMLDKMDLMVARGRRGVPQKRPTREQPAPQAATQAFKLGRPASHARGRRFETRRAQLEGPALRGLLRLGVHARGGEIPCFGRNVGRNVGHGVRVSPQQRHPAESSRRFRTPTRRGSARRRSAGLRREGPRSGTRSLQATTPAWPRRRQRVHRVQP
jgi:hypothetical protein